MLRKRKRRGGASLALVFRCPLSLSLSCSLFEISSGQLARVRPGIHDRAIYLSFVGTEANTKVSHQGAAGKPHSPGLLEIFESPSLQMANIRGPDTRPSGSAWLWGPRELSESHTLRPTSHTSTPAFQIYRYAYAAFRAEPRRAGDGCPSTEHSSSVPDCVVALPLLHLLLRPAAGGRPTPARMIDGLTLDSSQPRGTNGTRAGRRLSAQSETRRNARLTR